MRLKLSRLRLERPRQWGGCWLALQLWRQLELDEFWAARLPASRKRTRWDEVLLILVVHRLLSPGSEWRLHREWYQRSALADLLGTDSVIDSHVLYACHDRLLEHKTALFDHLVGRWRDLFNATFEVLLSPCYVVLYLIRSRLGLQRELNPALIHPAHADASLRQTALPAVATIFAR